MLRRVYFGVGIAVALTVLFAFMVMAQTPETEDATEGAETEQPVIEPILASLVQSVPVTLTLSVPGPTGTQTIEVPIMLSFDIQVGISNQITTSVDVTAVDVTAEETAEDDAAAEAVEAESTPEVETVAPTPVRIGVTTATPVVATATATAVAPTPTPTVVVTEEADDEEADDSAAEDEAVDEGTGDVDTESPDTEPTDTEEADAEDTDTTQEEDEEATPEDGATEEVVGEACTVPGVLITSPTAGQVVSGTVPIEGWALHENFDYYKLEYDIVGDDVEDFIYFDGTEAQVTNAQLGALDSEELPNGPLTVRLTVVDQTGNFPPPCDVTIVIDN